MKKRIVDVCMTVLMLCLMAYQVTGEAAHEWIGIGMTVLVIVHQILTGAPKRAQVTTIFANPDVNAACQVRGMIRSGKLNMATLMEQQRILLQNNKPLFSQIL